MRHAHTAPASADLRTTEIKKERRKSKGEVQVIKLEQLKGKPHQELVATAGVPAGYQLLPRLSVKLHVHCVLSLGCGLLAADVNAGPRGLPKADGMAHA
jgi:hypothetical protein